MELSYDARVEAEIGRGPRPEVTYPGHPSRLLCVGVERMLLAGEPIASSILSRLKDSRSHEVRVTMG